MDKAIYIFHHGTQMKRWIEVALTLFAACCCLGGMILLYFGMGG